MRRYAVDLTLVPEEIRAGLQEIMQEYSGRFANDSAAVPLRFQREGVGLSMEKGDDYLVRYNQKSDAFRALGRLLGEPIDECEDFSEVACLDMMGVMIDVSRNGVVRPDAMRALLRRYALMGLNMVVLYAEDTYEVPGEPFFGYLRGAYTHDEMKALDDYAFDLGIEMFPCIQALAHLAQILQWPEYAEYQDTDHVLIADEEKTYELIEKMITAASAPFRSKRIHVGMDEAAGIGSGRYKDKHGEKNPFDILNEHLARVRDICINLDLKPMIWSDMYFRLGSKTHDYYDRELVIPQEVADKISKDVQLVYWDYYHLDKDFYSEWIDRHRALGSEPIVAGGVWTWNRFWATLPFSFKATEACVGACKEKGVREVFMTLWGDGGMECDIFSALPGLQYFAELAYSDVVDPVRLRANFRGSCDADFDDWLRASDLDAVPSLEKPEDSYANVSKWLLWQDPFLAIMDPLMEEAELREHYQELADDLFVAAKKGGSAERLNFPAHLASALVLKTHLRRDLAAAYASGDRARLQQMVDNDIPTLMERVQALWKCHREMWVSTYKPFGWESIERRYGGIHARLDNVLYRLQNYLNEKIDALPELEAKLELLFNENGEQELPVVHASRVATPSFLKY
jgi:hexosaminidase